jgi:hypothetical protein
VAYQTDGPSGTKVGDGIRCSFAWQDIEENVPNWYENPYTQVFPDMHIAWYCASRRGDAGKAIKMLEVSSLLASYFQFASAPGSPYVAYIDASGNLLFDNGTGPFSSEVAALNVNIAIISAGLASVVSALPGFALAGVSTRLCRHSGSYPHPEQLKKENYRC